MLWGEAEDVCSEMELSGVDWTDPLVYYELNGGQSLKSTKAGFVTDRELS